MKDNSLTKNCNVLIAPVKEADEEFICSIANNENLMSIFHDNPSKLQDWQYAIKEWLQDEDVKDYIIIRKEDKLPVGWVGINGLKSKDRSAWLKIIAIKPEYWGENYGSKTVAMVKNILKEQGYKKIFLWTDEANLRAQLCYKKNNFNIIDKQKLKVGSKELFKDRLLMECDL